MAQIAKIKRKWKLKRDLEAELKILTKKRAVVRSILISILQEAVELKKANVWPIFVFAFRVRLRGGYSAAYVHELFDRLAFDYSPQAIKPYNDFEMGKMGELEPALKNLLTNDLTIWNKLADIGAVSFSERRDIEEIGELLDEFYGNTDRAIRA